MDSFRFSLSVQFPILTASIRPIRRSDRSNRPVERRSLPGIRHKPHRAEAVPISNPSDSCACRHVVDASERVYRDAYRSARTSGPFIGPKTVAAFRDEDNDFIRDARKFIGTALAPRPGIRTRQPSQLPFDSGMEYRIPQPISTKGQ